MRFSCFLFRPRIQSLTVFQYVQPSGAQYLLRDRAAKKMDEKETALNRLGICAVRTM